MLNFGLGMPSTSSWPLPGTQAPRAASTGCLAAGFAAGLARRCLDGVLALALGGAFAGCLTRRALGGGLLGGCLAGAFAGCLAGVLLAAGVAAFLGDDFVGMLSLPSMRPCRATCSVPFADCLEVLAAGFGLGRRGRFGGLLGRRRSGLAGLLRWTSGCHVGCTSWRCERRTLSARTLDGRDRSRPSYAALSRHDATRHRSRVRREVGIEPSPSTTSSSVSRSTSARCASKAAITSRAAAHVERDPVGHVETGVAPRLLDLADQVAGASLELELGRDRRCRARRGRTSPSASPPRPRPPIRPGSRTPPAGARRRRRRRAVGVVIVQSPALWALITSCVRPPSRGPSVFGLRISSLLPKRSTSVVSSTSLTLSSSRRMSMCGCEQRRVGSRHDRPRQRQAHAQSLRLAQRQQRRAGVAHLLHAGVQFGVERELIAAGQSVRCTLRRRRPAHRRVRDTRAR